MIRNGRFCALSPKTYFSINLETNSKKTGLKGVPHAEARKISIQNVLNCLYYNTQFNAITRQFRFNAQNQMAYKESNKKALNSVFRKFYVENDRITCSPLQLNGKYL